MSRNRRKNILCGYFDWINTKWGAAIGCVGEPFWISSLSEPKLQYKQAER